MLPCKAIQFTLLLSLLLQYHQSLLVKWSDDIDPSFSHCSMHGTYQLCYDELKLKTIEQTTSVISKIKFDNSFVAYKNIMKKRVPPSFFIARDLLYPDRACYNAWNMNHSFHHVLPIEIRNDKKSSNSNNILRGSKSLAMKYEIPLYIAAFHPCSAFGNNLGWFYESIGFALAHGIAVGRPFKVSDCSEYGIGSIFLHHFPRVIFPKNLQTFQSIFFK